MVTPAPRDLALLRRWAVEAASLPLVGVSRDAAFLSMDPRRDPACLATEMALIRYHTEWWYTTLPPELRPGDHLGVKVLTAAYTAAAAVYRAGCSYGTLRKDPVSFALRAASMVGWSFENATHVRDQHGGLLALLDGPPALLRRRFREAWRDAAAGRLLERASPSQTPAQRHEYSVGLCLDVPRRVANSGGKHQLPQSRRRTLVRLASGNYPTGSWMHACGLLATPLCPHGCGVPDTVGHRVWVCGHGADGRHGVDPGLLAWARERLGQPEVEMGWRPAPVHLAHCADEQWVCAVDGAEMPAADLVFTPGEHFYIDSSVARPSDRRLVRGACAVVQ